MTTSDAQSDAPTRRRALHRFANPARFLRAARVVLPVSTAACLLCLGAGLYLGLAASPPDYQQGESVRIMYVHVPAAWAALLVYLVIAGSSFAALVWKHPLGDLIAMAAAPIGAVFTLLALASGSLWGKPMWGTWWVWDARLTSFLILFFLYLGHIALSNAFDDPVRGSRAASILALVGAVNIPVIKFSVDWWNTLHQPASILRGGGPSIDPSMLAPLALMAAAFMLFFVSVGILRLRAEVARRKLRMARFGSWVEEA